MSIEHEDTKVNMNGIEEKFRAFLKDIGAFSGVLLTQSGADDNIGVRNLTVGMSGLTAIGLLECAIDVHKHKLLCTPALEAP